MNDRVDSTAWADAPEETYRATMQARLPDNQVTTIIVTRHGAGRHGRVWLTMNASIRCTIALTDQQASTMIDLLGQASRWR